MECKSEHFFVRKTHALKETANVKRTVLFPLDQIVKCPVRICGPPPLVVIFTPFFTFSL